MSQYMVQFAMCLMLNRTRMLKPDLPFSAAVRPQMHIYGQLSLKITGLAGFGKRMNRPVMQVLEFRRGEFGSCRAQRVVRASRIA